MSDQLFSSITTVVMAIIGVAILAVLVSRNSNTSGVLTAGGGAFSNILGAALSPVSGSGVLGGGRGFTGGGVSIGGF